MQSLVPVTLTYVFLDWIAGLFARRFDKVVGLECEANNSSSAPVKLDKLGDKLSSGDNGDSNDDDTASIASTNTTASNGSDVISSDDDEEGVCEVEGDGEIKMKEKSDVIQMSTSTSSPTKTKYCIVLTGAKMSKHLHLVRCLRAHQLANPATIEMKIVVLEQDKFRYNATRLSNCVDAFRTITSPRVSPEAYITDILNVCREFQATHFLPVAAPAEAICDAEIRKRLDMEENPNGTKVLHMRPELCLILDDKHQFGTFLKHELGLGEATPKTMLVNSDDEARSFNADLLQQTNLKRNMVIKNLAYDPHHRLDLFLLPAKPADLDKYLATIRADGNPISAEEPWQLQEFLSGGKEYAASCIVRQNEIVAMTACPSSASQLNYIHCEQEAITRWLENFVAALERRRCTELEAGRDASRFTLDGQLCFDFMILQEDGVDVAFPIECNPRLHTQCSVYNAEDAREALGGLLLAEPRTEGVTMRKLKKELAACLVRDFENTTNNVYWFYNEFFKTMPNSWLLSYEGADDDGDYDVADNVSTLKLLWTAFLYLPAFVTAITVALPVWTLLILTTGIQALPSQKLMLDFLRRLAVPSEHVEGDYWRRDPTPFVAKNHVQIASRLLATIRTGVEWKKIDFAIGKVVEVGGD